MRQTSAVIAYGRAQAPRRLLAKGLFVATLCITTLFSLYIAVWFSITRSLLDVEWWGPDVNLYTGSPYESPLKKNAHLRELFLPAHYLDERYFRPEMWEDNISPRFRVDD